MKKLISMILMAAMLITATISMTSCGEVIGCDLCNNEDKKSRMHEIEIWGEKAILCDECYDEMMEIAEEFN